MTPDFACNGLLAEGGVDLLQPIALFALAAFLMAFAVLLIGRIVRPSRPSPEKSRAYECGEEAYGPGWVQFDLRFYVVALVFLIFDVEIALFYPWAVVFGGATVPGASWEVLRSVRIAALWDLLFFFGVIVVGFLYLWRFGYLDWVRSTTAQAGGEPSPSASEGPANAVGLGRVGRSAPMTESLAATALAHASEK